MSYDQAHFLCAGNVTFPVAFLHRSCAHNQMLTGPDHEAELEEVPRIPEETPRSRDLQGVSYFIQISLCGTTE